jgi:hypothetical protein
MTRQLPMAHITPHDAWTGSRFINMRDPQPDDFVLSEIARGLSRECRYGGAATSVEWTVGQHLLLCDHYAEEDDCSFEDRRVIFAHDFPEYMLRDMIRPAKQCLPDYQELEDVWWTAMADRFDLPGVMPSIVRHYDVLVAAVEKREFISEKAGAWPGIPDTDRLIPDEILTLENLDCEGFLLARMETLYFK